MQETYHGVTCHLIVDWSTHDSWKFDLPQDMFLHTDSPHYFMNHNDGETEAEFLGRIVNNLEDLILKEGPETIAAMFAGPFNGSRWSNFTS